MGVHPSSGFPLIWASTKPGEDHTATASIQVADPQITAVKLIEDSYPSGVQGVGMVNLLTFNPLSVSFGYIEWLEEPSGAINVTGYFSNLNADLSHHPNPDWLPVNDSNSGLTDHAASFGAPPPWSAGTFSWDIPNKARPTSSGNGHVFQQVLQDFAILDSTGTSTVSKYGITVPRTP